MQQLSSNINLQVIHIIDPTLFLCGKNLYFIYHLSNVLVSTNSSINFIVYCLIRKKFQTRLKKFCHCKDYYEDHKHDSAHLTTLTNTCDPLLTQSDKSAQFWVLVLIFQCLAIMYMSRVWYTVIRLFLMSDNSRLFEI